jgi:hypothetical protein
MPARVVVARLAVDSETVDPHAGLDRIVVCHASSAHPRGGLSFVGYARMRRRTSPVTEATVLPRAASIERAADVITEGAERSGRVRGTAD